MTIEKIKISDLPLTDKENEGYSIVVRDGKTEKYKVRQSSWPVDVDFLGDKTYEDDTTAIILRDTDNV